GKVAQVYPFEEWERIEQKLSALPTFNPTKKKFLSRVNYYGQVVEMDGQGRLLIPQLLRDSAEIKGDVAVTGNLSYLKFATCSCIARRSRSRRLHLRMSRRSTIWASSGRGFNRHPRAGWAWNGSWPCPGSFKRSDRLFRHQAWRDIYRRDGGLGRAQLRNRKTPRRTGSFDWLR